MIIPKLTYKGARPIKDKLRCTPKKYRKIQVSGDLISAKWGKK